MIRRMPIARPHSPDLPRPRHLVVAAVAALAVLGIIFALPARRVAELKEVPAGGARLSPLPDWVYEPVTADGRRIAIDFTRTGTPSNELEPLDIQVLRYRLKRVVGQLAYDGANSRDGQQLIDQAIRDGLADSRRTKDLAALYRAERSPSSPPPEATPRP